MSYYKVTSTKITKSKRGYTVFNFQLNEAIWVSKLAPIRSSDKKYDALYKLYEENNGSLESLVGKYIVASIHESEYGLQLNYITSYDLIRDFKKLLDNANGKPFSTDMPIYDFLKAANYPLNLDGSIRLKKPYNFYIIINHNGSSICYQDCDKENTLTLNNMEIIYKQFYDAKYIETGDVDLDCKYRLSQTAILKHCDKYHKYKSKTIRSYDTVVMQIGDDLSTEQIEYLSLLNRQ